MTIHLIMLNGLPGSGKDLFSETVKRIIETKSPAAVHSISTIAVVEQMLGIDSGNKTPEARRVKSLVGDVMEEYNSMRTISVLNYFMQLSYSPNTHNVVFVHCRERKVIDKIKHATRILLPQIAIHDAFLIRQGHDETVNSNASDIEVGDIHLKWAAYAKVINIEQNGVYYDGEQELIFIEDGIVNVDAVANEYVDRLYIK